MALKYHVVRRCDLRKGAPQGSMLYYGQIRVANRVKLPKLCELISALSTASEGDVEVILEAMVMLMDKNLQEGKIVELGDLGNFRIVAGSPGVETEKEFHTSLFKRGRIVYTPSKRLKRDLCTRPTYEPYPFKVVDEQCARPHAG